MSLPYAANRAVLLGFAALFAASAATSDPTYQSLRQATVAESLMVENIVLRRDAGVLTLKSGTLGLLTPVMGHETMAVFSGEGEFTLTPSMPIETRYLESLTGQKTVAEPFDRALFCFTDDSAREIRGQARTKAPEGRGADILKEFRKRLRNESSENIEAGILADLLREGQAGFFSAYLHGRKHSDLRFHLRPRGAEPALGPEEVLLFNVQPAGVPDEIWYHAHRKEELAAGTASSDEDHRTTAAESYTIDSAIAGNQRLSGTTRIAIRGVAAGERVISLSLVPTLRVSRATADGQEIAFIQEDKQDDGALSIVLPKPVERGSVHELVLEYEGDKVIRNEGGGNFAVGARESWYPNLNTFHDHARFDLTFRVPKRFTLVSVGKLEKEWTEKDVACSRWVSETPLAVAGFNYGTFKKKAVTDSQLGIAIEGYATAQAPDYLRAVDSENAAPPSPARLMESTMIDAENALRVYAAWFGKPAFDRIAITQQPQFNFGQSWPSLVYLPMAAYLDSTERWRLMGINNRLTAFVEEVTPHEVAHQYWGHMVGWATYHDQWLSEGFATFSAGLTLQFTRKNLDPYIHYWEQARKRVTEKNQYGRRANDAGPVWLGVRLSSEKNAGAYSNVVYEKGAYVLHMIRQMMYDPKNGDRPFIAAMQDFVKQHATRNASTESFQKAIERHMTPNMDLMGNGKLDWFFSEWIYGTALPKYKLDYSVNEENGKVVLKGSVTQSDVPDDFMMLVPIYADFDGNVARLGSARLVGNSTLTIDTALPKKPKRVMLNYFHDVLEQ